MAGICIGLFYFKRESLILPGALKWVNIIEDIKLAGLEHAENLLKHQCWLSNPDK